MHVIPFICIHLRVFSWRNKQTLIIYYPLPGPVHDYMYRLYIGINHGLTYENTQSCICDRIWEKLGTISCIFWIFVLKCSQLGKYSRYRFNFGVMIFTSSCYTLKEFHAMPTIWFEQGEQAVNHVWKLPFYASLWLFTVRYRIGKYRSSFYCWICKVEGLNCLQPSGKPGALMALEWWQVEKQQKITFCAIILWSLYSYVIGLCIKSTRYIFMPIKYYVLLYAE